MRISLSLAAGILVLTNPVLFAASYTKTDGSVVNPILHTNTAVHPYLGSNLDENASVTNADLSDANLEDADLAQAILTGVDLSNADLGNADLRFALLSNANLSGADLASANLSSADLTGVSLAGADLSDANLGSALLTGVSGQLGSTTNLSLPVAYKLHNSYIIGPEVDLGDADLTGIDVSGMDLSHVNLTGATLIGVEGQLANATNLTLPDGYIVANNTIVGPGANLNSAVLSGEDLQGVDLSGVSLSLAILDGVDLTGANLSGATMTFALLNNSVVTNADLSGADLSSASLTGLKGQLAATVGVSLPTGYVSAGNHIIGPGVNLMSATLPGVTLTGLDLGGVNLSGADLSGAILDTIDLDGANLGGADLSGASFLDGSLINATLSGATLANADLGNAIASGANFAGADLQGADLEIAILGGAVFTGARYNENTKFPSGTDPLALGMILITVDTDGDGVADFVELAFGGDPADGTDAQVSVTAVEEREEKFSAEQILDLRVGGVMLQRDGANFTLNYTIEESEDLINWTPFPDQPGPFVFAPSDAEKKFVHITIEE